MKLFEYLYLKKTHKFAFAKIKDYQMDLRGRGDFFVLVSPTTTEQSQHDGERVG